MSLILHFNQTKIPRSVTRQEWKEIWRWKRITERKLNVTIQQEINDLVIFGSTIPQHIKSDILDKLAYPPLLLGPYQ